MCQYSATDGLVNDWHLVNLGSRAVGGYSLVVAEATAVEPQGRITPGDAGLWSEDHVAPFRRITSFLEAQGAVPGIQLAHAGRKASAASPWQGNHHLKEGQGEQGWPTKAPSALQFDPEVLWKVPSALSVAEIKEIQERFAAAAERAVKAGFKVVEIHSAHGYLLHEFLSPLANKREDEYGGSFENRIRFLEETVERVRKVLPEETPLFVRISATDWHPEGWTLDDSVRLSKILKGKGVDLVDCSSMGVIPNFKDVPFGPNFQVPLAERIRREAGILTAAVGFLTEAQQMEKILQEEKADLVFQARESLRNPYFPIYAAKELGLPDPFSLLPVQYSAWLSKM